MAKNYALALRKSMQKMCTYRPEYENAIAAQLMEQYDTLTRAFEESGWAYETSTATGTKKAPIVTTLESLRKDVLAYLSALGLTPAGAKKLDAVAAAKAQDDPLVAALKSLSG